MADKLMNEILPGSIWDGKDGRSRHVVSVYVDSMGETRIDFTVRTKDNHLVKYKGKRLRNFLAWSKSSVKRMQT